MRLAAPLIFAALFLVSACGGSGRASVSPGPMPPNGSFTGVWFSPQYGEMHMRQSGAAVIGEYSKDERAGRIQGTVQGNLLRYTWQETRELVVGRPSTTKGRGYFKLVIGDDGRENILGEWGIDENEIGGGPWNAYRLKNRQPELSTDKVGAEGGPDEDAPDWGSTPGGGGESSEDGLEGDGL